jgi:hypothetical protein
MDDSQVLGRIDELVASGDQEVESDSASVRLPSTKRTTFSVSQ